jgi:hypothetical protein
MPEVVSGVGTSFNLPNYAGELFTASPKKTPFLSLIGGLTGGKTSNSFEFVTGQNYDLPEANQPEVSETASLTAPTASHIAREQKTNTCQIFHESIDLSYAKLSQTGQLAGLNLAGQNANPASEEDWQIQQKLKIVAQNVEYSFLNGSYQKATNATTAAKTRGMFELTSDADSTQIDAASAPLTKAMLDSLFKGLVDNGAYWDNMHLFVGSTLKQAITSIYASQFNARMAMQDTKAGMNIVEIETDFGSLNIVFDPYVPNGKLLVADIAHVAPVFCPVPGKGVLFVEELAKTGADNKKQLYGQIGLDHGMAYMHGSIINIA